MDDITGGDIYIGCAESYLVKYLARAVKKLSSIYPNIHYHVTSGDTEQVTERLDRGLLDMAFIVEPPDLSKYNYLEVPEYDTWGVLMRKDYPLGVELTFDKLVETNAESDLCFRPITPPLHTKMYVIWKKYQIFTPVANLLLEEIKKIIVLP